MIQDMYNKMTPEQYQKGINMAINRTRDELTKQFQKKYEKLVKEFDSNLKDGMATAINAISVELFYELAVQMNAFDEEDKERLESIKYRIKEIHDNTINSIEKYASYKNDRQAYKEFKKRKQKVEKMFDIKF